MHTFDDLFRKHLGPSLAKHLSFLHVIEGLPCDVDMEAGNASFGDHLSFPVQLLGFEERSEGSWTWGWAVEAPLPAQLLRDARWLKVYGERHDMEIFTLPSFATEDFDGDDIAVLGCGLLNSQAFFVAITDDDEAAYFLVPDLLGQVPTERPAVVVAEVIARMLDIYAIPQPATALRPYLAFEGYEVDEREPQRWTARHPRGSWITLAFDRQGRLVKVKASDEPPRG
jgi:hypothetical protein